jgi:hypothetical protein
VVKRKKKPEHLVLTKPKPRPELGSGWYPGQDGTENAPDWLRSEPVVDIGVDQRHYVVRK